VPVAYAALDALRFVLTGDPEFLPNLGLRGGGGRGRGQGEWKGKEKENEKEKEKGD